MAKEDKTVEEKVVTDDAAGEVTEVNITAGDLSTMVKLIDAGSQRGAWRGEELSTIGGLRQKLVAVVNAIAPAAEGDVPVEASEEDSDKAEGGDEAAA